MNLKKYIRVLSTFIIFTLFAGVIVSADVPDVVNIITEKGIIHTVQYENFDLNVEKIRLKETNDIVYCLEINKKYPSGQKFSVNVEADEKINNIIAAGYPNRSIAELNLNNEDDAYFATQIAIWSAVEGYDISKIRSNNPKILEAIKNIYNNGISAKYKDKIKSKIYKTSDESIQDVIIAYANLTSEDEAESGQNEYPPQEG